MVISSGSPEGRSGPEPPGDGNIGAMPRGAAVPEAASDAHDLNATQTRNPIPSPNVHPKRTAIFIQDECLKHRFIRSRDTTGIFERPERLHALKLGLAAAISRIEDVQSAMNVRKPELVSAAAGTDEDDLVVALARMAIEPPTVAPASSSSTSSPRPIFPLRTTSVIIRRTSASVSLLDHAAVKYVHGDIERDLYIENLIAWARDSQANISEKGTEIPEGIPPLDLYLCPGSIDAIQGAIGAVCEAVDASMAATRGSQQLSGGQDGPCERAFVAIRPPGHHCGEDTPSGFCFINNVAVGAAHAHLNHGIQRVVILDIDLHHGNGTQSIVWQINEETYQQTLELPKTDAPPAKLGPRIFYGSLHDILSFPCEDGKPDLVQAASTSIHGPHGQYVENIHLQRYDSEAHFWNVLYPRYLALLHCARNFLDETGGPGDDVIIFISCGFDAGEHEYPSMSRHHRKVPVGFYHRFTRETCKLADAYARGRVVSVLEGGYSDRALTSGAMAHLCGLVDIHSQGPSSDLDADSWVDHAWWSKANLVKLENAAKPRKSVSVRASMEDWLTRAVDLLPVLGGDGAGTSKKGSSTRNTSTDANTSAWTLPASRTLRPRKKPALDDARAGDVFPDSTRTTTTAVAAKKGSGSRRVSASVKPSAERANTGTSSPSQAPSADLLKSESGQSGMDPREEVPSHGAAKKKLPRVILHVRPPDTG